jgi:hypothetical protein
MAYLPRQTISDDVIQHRQNLKPAVNFLSKPAILAKSRDGDENRCREGAVRLRGSWRRRTQRMALLKAWKLYMIK